MNRKIVLVAVVCFLLGFLAAFFFAVQKQANPDPGNGSGIVSPIGTLPLPIPDPLPPQTTDPGQGVSPGSPIGGDVDDHGCLIGGGYSWCESKQKCLRTWEETCLDSFSTPDYEAHGCSGFAGESWCAAKQKCLRVNDPAWDASCEGKTTDSSCKLEGCHGLDISCGSNGDLACTMMYQLGDKCRAYAQCGVINGRCQQKQSPKFDSCKSCVQKCAVQYPNDAIKVMECEGKC